MDNTPACVRAVLDKPGKYRFNQTAWFWYFEVDARRRVYQLTPDTLRRDGVLSPDGWNECAASGTVTPLLVADAT